MTIPWGRVGTLLRSYPLMSKLPCNEILFVLYRGTISQPIIDEIQFSLQDIALFTNTMIRFNDVVLFSM
ncbi:ORF53 protein [Operophtera brumata nucleopolyhedrovirus]|jgi:hypothetical protein|uniref:ORF53 protein n=1 Tax=Operophtera brumata nucleopolyhedrovirus TaxID=1046267 RepID=A0A2H4UZQ4_9ABAC|nr:ORF53 protein [Operophtera brumata nucleopolyhedrovirus]AUA60284.1 ORF53 protein [Operophtera brumata nucleopolyhedrovirus]